MGWLSKFLPTHLRPDTRGDQKVGAIDDGVAIGIQGDNNTVIIRRDDPQVRRLFEIEEAKRKSDDFYQAQISRSQADADRERARADALEQENKQLRQQREDAIRTTVAASREPNPTPAALAAVQGLEAGDTRPAGALLAEREHAAAERARRAESDARAAHLEAAALARQQGALLIGQDTTTALAAYQRAASYDPDDTWTRFFIGDLYKALGQLNDALQAYREARASVDRRLTKDAQDADAQRDLSVSHERIGDVLLAQGDGPAALAAYRAGLAIAETLAPRDPANTEWQDRKSVV